MWGPDCLAAELQDEALLLVQLLQQLLCPAAGLWLLLQQPAPHVLPR